MRDIAREVGIEAASIYNHISSKQLILNELLMALAQQFTEGMERISESDLPMVKKLEALIALHVDITATHTDAISLLPNEWVHLQEPYLKTYLGLRDAYEHEFKGIIAASMENGELEYIDHEVALFSILSTLRWLYSWYSKYSDKSVAVLKEELIKSLLYGFK